MTLRDRVISAFAEIKVPWPNDVSKAIALGGAAVQSYTEHEAGLVCDVSKDNARNVRNARLLVYLCQVAGWPEPECDQWIGATLRTAIQATKPTMRRKVVGALQFDLMCTKQQVTLAIKERV